MKKLLVCAVLFACAPEPKASRVEVAPLPTPEKAGAGAPGGGQNAPHDDMRLVVHEQSGDRDGDGIVDAIDKCPDDPEDFDGFEDDDGCPDPDNDRDGIPDVQDKCPNLAGPPPDGCPKSRP